MSSSELQRISLAVNKVVSLEGAIELSPLVENEDDETVQQDDDDDEDDEDDEDEGVANTPDEEKIDTTIITVSSIGSDTSAAPVASAKVIGLVNGHHSPGNDVGNTTTTSSVGDLTMDSIRDHLNSSTITTLHKQTTEEVVGKF